MCWMIGICNSDRRNFLLYQQLKHTADCILLEDGKPVHIDLDILILPVSGIRNDKTMMMKGMRIPIADEFIQMVKRDGLIICGNVTDLLVSYDRKILDISQMESYTLGNSRLTAEGVLYLLLDNTQKGLFDLKVDLIGFGASGKAIYNMLRLLGVRVRVIRRHLEDAKDNFVTVEDYQRLKPFDVIINTSLTNIIDEDMIRKMDENLIINLVGDADINEVLLRTRQVRIVHAGPLPALLSPLSAANLLMKTLQEVLYD